VTGPLVAALEPAIASALAEATAMRPDIVAGEVAADAAAALSVPDPTPLEAPSPTEVQALAAVRPPPRPVLAAPAGTAGPAVEPVSDDAIALALAQALAEPPTVAAETLAEQGSDSAPPEPGQADSVVLAAVPPPRPDVQMADDNPDEPAIAGVGAFNPTEEPDEFPTPPTSSVDSGIILATVRPDAVIPPAPETQVVTRLSTSGRQNWTVSLGRFNTRDAAERALLRAALAGIGTLDTADRRVRQTGGAWEATFPGLHEETATIACQRLALRGTSCTPIEPGS